MKPGALDVDWGKVLVTDGPIQPDHIWKLEESKAHPGYYYIINVAVTDAKISNHVTGITYYTGDRLPNQLWRFEEAGCYSYRIYSFKKKSAMLTVLEKRQVNTFSGGLYGDQLWDILPATSAL